MSINNPGHGDFLKAVILAAAVTLFASPAAGLDIPDEPLQSSGRVAPNVLFILDDSGSMSWDAMPANAIGSDFDGRNYIRNTLYYNPANTYRPWINADGTYMTVGTTYEAVYGDFNRIAGGTINLKNPLDCRRYNQNNNATGDEMPGGTQVCGGVQTFLVPKNPSNTDPVYLANQSNYYRFQILTNGQVVRSERLNRVGLLPPYNNGMPGVGCDTMTPGLTWRQCTFATPTGRSETDERNNYATWFSYHRTRMKAAKAGAGQAFNGLGSNIRVGFRTIWERNGAGGGPGNRPTQAVPIPVNFNDGLFTDFIDASNTLHDNKTQWYQRLYDTIGFNGTPLHGALDKAGRYFQSSAQDGPWGPQTGVDQYACRQNFSILTTDGFWNAFNNYPVHVNEQDASAGTAIANPIGGSYTYTPGPPYASTFADTLADVAMRYWKDDLRPTLPNVVPTSAQDPGFWQHMVTFGISIGLRGTLDPATDLPALEAGTLNWPNPNDTENSERIDDLWHAAVNGRGEFIAASNPDEFTQGLRAALGAIAQRTGSFANLATTSTSVRAGTLAFQASFVSGQWSGELKAYPVTAAGIDTLSPPLWSASAALPLPASRKIFTWTGMAGATFPTGTQQTMLARAAMPAVSGAENADYIRGVRTLELNNGGTLRNRLTVLGDIVNSSPVYDPETSTVYVGANDGMLHAFDASALGAGKEHFAYVPGGIDIAALSTLSDPAYSHRYFVDGPITLSRRDQTPNKTWLVGALGRGGTGIYTLDVTNPSAPSATMAKWEATQTPGNNMGKVLGQPVIAKLNSGHTAVIVPNGVDSPTGRAALLVYDLATGALLSEIDTGIGSPVAENGLFSPTVRDTNGDGRIDYVYAGDLRGNLWKFNMTSASASDWSLPARRTLLFSAGASKPITSAPSIARDPATYKVWVFFGTGRFITNGDLTNMDVQSIYGMEDGTSTIPSSDLQQRHVSVTGTVNGRIVRGFEIANSLPYGKKGWVIDLVQPPSPPGTAEGERIVSDVQVVAGALIFSSIIPSKDPCQPGGSGYLNALDAFTGASTTESLFDLDMDGDYQDEVIPGGGGSTPVGSVRLNGMGSLGTVLTGGGGGGQICLNISDATIECNRIREARQVGRVSWRELVRD
ncbi:MAG: pilus assembly protein [Xanthomonadaceae bacterium]|nr:pilus assembly protein [Xanthomonadaceae bacterium]